MAGKYEMKQTSEKHIYSYKTKDGEIKFMYRLYLGKDKVTGELKNTTARGFDSVSDAIAARDMKKEKYEARKKFSSNRPILFSELVTLWLEDYRETVEPSTFDKTAGMVKNHIIPIMGHLEFENFTPLDCRNFVRKFSQRVKYHHKLTNYASLALGYAVLLGYLDANPFDKLSSSDKKGLKADSSTNQDSSGKRQYFLPYEINTLLDYLEKENDFKVYVFFRFLAYSGCRKGEALALTWDKINFEDKVVTINAAISTAKGKGLYQTATKGAKAKQRKSRPIETRRIALDDQTLTLLKEWKIQQKELLKMMNLKQGKRNQLVFQNSNNEHIYPTQTERWLSNARKNLAFSQEMEFTPHALRHSHATICAANKVPLVTIQKRLGHSCKDITSKYYIHLTAESDREASETFVNALAKA